MHDMFVYKDNCHMSTANRLLLPVSRNFGTEE